ncbi:Embryonic polyadenylate-binding A [Paramuricea clavata]|uniref:Embryonic polyadenylate-binding A n=1 Tax=Paramuricea clavata TaxID=317549 RepID=A0A6S7I815_PARCT|nr:Embryonic polyadenylate-binding A [Paramuricea clavata]
MGRKLQKIDTKSNIQEALATVDSVLARVTSERSKLSALLDRLFNARYSQEIVVEQMDYETELTKLESLGDVLYTEVEAVYSEHEIAEKITGMLLELNVDEIERLMKHKSELLVKIHEAFAVLQRHSDNELKSPTIKEWPASKTELGEKIFERILQWYMDEETTAKLTGMLLEMNIDEITKLTQEDELLKCKADEAFRALTIQR